MAGILEAALSGFVSGGANNAADQMKKEDELKAKEAMMAHEDELLRNRAEMMATFSNDLQQKSKIADESRAKDAKIDDEKRAREAALKAGTEIHNVSVGVDSDADISHLDIPAIKKIVDEAKDPAIAKQYAGILNQRNIEEKLLAERDAAEKLGYTSQAKELNADLRTFVADKRADARASAADRSAASAHLPSDVQSIEWLAKNVYQNEKDPYKAALDSHNKLKSKDPDAQYRELMGKFVTSSDYLMMGAEEKQKADDKLRSVLGLPQDIVVGGKVIGRASTQEEANAIIAKYKGAPAPAKTNDEAKETKTNNGILASQPRASEVVAQARAIAAKYKDEPLGYISGGLSENESAIVESAKKLGWHWGN